jgi:hypothetical protein
VSHGYRFRRCAICGTPGHPRRDCPIREYEAELEHAARERVTAQMLFPGRPDLVALLEDVQRSWMQGRAAR